MPEYALGDMKALSPSMVEELADWGDYLYDASPLATLKGKKMSKNVITSTSLLLAIQTGRR